MNWARQLKWKLCKAFLYRPLPRHYLQIKTKKMLDVVIYRLTPYVRVESLNKHDRSCLPGFRRSKTDHNRSSSTLISARNDVFSSKFSFYIGSAWKSSIAVPHSKIDKSHLGINKKTRTQQFSHGSHWRFVRQEQMSRFKGSTCKTGLWFWIFPERNHDKIILNE